MRRVLQLPVYRRLLGAYTLNELAWSIGTLALAFLVYARTRSAFGATAFFLCSLFVPALLSPLVVARLDQRTPRHVLPVLYALEGVAFLALAWIASHFSLIGVLLLTAVDGVIALVARSLARAATVDVTAAADLLREGNAVNNTAFSLCFMAGPAIGGVIVATASTSVALLANSALFLVIAFTLATARGLPAAAPEPEAAAGRVRAALAYIRQQPSIRTLFSVQVAGVLFFTISIPAEVIFAEHTLDSGAGGYGALLSSWGVGAVAGSAAYARWRERPSRQLIAIGAAALGVGFAVMAAAPVLEVAVAGSVIAGVGNGIESVAARTALQEEVEPQWMSLMMGFNESMFQLVPGLGILLGGAIASLAGPRATLAIGAAGSLVVTAVVWVVLRPGMLRADSDPSLPTLSAQPEHQR
jgi:predicted MFS family arabinose efflux permease